MTGKPQAAPGEALSGNSKHEHDRLDAAADQAIAACGGDMRSAIRALILANEFLEHEAGELMKTISKGYARSRFAAPELPKDRRDWYD